MSKTVAAEYCPSTGYCLLWQMPRARHDTVCLDPDITRIMSYTNIPPNTTLLSSSGCRSLPFTMLFYRSLRCPWQCMVQWAFTLRIMSYTNIPLNLYQVLDVGPFVWCCWLLFCNHLRIQSNSCQNIYYYQEISKMFWTSSIDVTFMVSCSI